MNCIAYLEQKSEENIIIVDWTSISRTIIYPSAASATLAVGRIVANFLINLYDQGNLYPDKVHLIGKLLRIIIPPSIDQYPRKK